MMISWNFITGLNLGVEFIAAEPDDGVDFNTVVIDLFILRVLLEFE